MKRARLHVFSGTGNSLHLARRLASSFEAAGARAQILEVSIADIGTRDISVPIERDSDDLDLFLFPVYAMAVPRIMVRYMTSLARPRAGSRPRAAVLATNGRINTRFRDGHEGQSLAQAERILARRGWDVVYRETFDYPQSITSFLNPHSEERKAMILTSLEPKIDRAAAEIRAGVRSKRRCGVIFHLIGWPFGWLFRLVGRRCWAMLFAADERCDGCGVCAACCPAGAIRMVGGRPAWNYACEGCDRCINRCPKAAIQTSALRFALVIALSIFSAALPGKTVLSTAAAPLVGTSVVAAAVFEIAWFILFLLAAFVLLRLADVVLVALGRMPALRPILGFGWTRWFRRYRVPG